MIENLVSYVRVFTVLMIRHMDEIHSVDVAYCRQQIARKDLESNKAM